MALIWKDPDNRVRRIHYEPERLTSEQKDSGIPVSEIPDPDNSRDGNPVLYHTEADGFWYEYIN
jgi:hypothetical protein